MKRLFTLTFSLAFGLSAFSQAIQNSGFENWSNTTLYSEPNSFYTSNLEAYFTSGQPNVTKSQDAQLGSFSLRLETYIINNDTINGLATLGIPSPNGIDGGIPYTQMPDSMVAYVKYNLMPNDTAVVGVGFKYGSNLTSQGLKTLTGTQNTWKRISTPIQYGSLSVDTMVAIFSCSNIDGNGIAGSYLLVDNIQLIGASQPLPNQSFENWSNASIEDPDNWSTLNLFSLIGGQTTVTKSTDAHGGNFAARIETKELVGDTVGFLFNGQLSSGGPVGGMQVNANPKKLSGYYKYSPVGPDTAVAGLIAYSYNATLDSLIPLDSALVYLVSANSYTSFQVSLTYNGFPPIDTLGILFSSSNSMEDYNYMGLGSVLLLDDLSLEYFPISVEEIDNSLQVAVYPNPAKSTLYLQYGDITENTKFEIFNLLGEKVLGRDIPSNAGNSTISVNTSSLANGVYIYKLTVGNRIKTGKIEIAK